VPIAEGEISWNGFLKQVGFNPPSVYEVSGESFIPASNDANEVGNQVQLRCLDGDWSLSDDRDNELGIAMSTGDLSFDGFVVNIVAVGNFIKEFETGVDDSYLKIIGYDGFARRNQPFPSDIPVTITILCHSPSSLMTVGGEWQATDTTALIIGYSVLNAYWIAPIGIGIGVGIYLVKRKIE